MRRRFPARARLALLLLVAACAVATPGAVHAIAPAAAPDSLRIIVTTESPVTRLDREVIRDLFLGRIPTLHAIPGVPDDGSEDARIRLFLSADAEEPFTRTFLDLSPRHFRMRWVKSLLSGATTHGPETVAGTPRVAALVAGVPGAFGVCRGGELPEGVRAVELGPPSSVAVEGR
jgi:hypothetical protein